MECINTDALIYVSMTRIYSIVEPLKYHIRTYLNFCYTYEVCLKSNGTRSINVLSNLTSKFCNMSPSN